MRPSESKQGAVCVIPVYSVPDQSLKQYPVVLAHANIKIWSEHGVAFHIIMIICQRYEPNRWSIDGKTETYV